MAEPIHRAGATRRAHSFARLLLAGLALLGSAPALAADPAAEPPAEELPAPPEDDWNRGTPRDAVLGYLESCREGNYERAANYLNLNPVPSSQREKRGPVLARQLKTVLDRELWVDLEQLSAHPAGDRSDGLPTSRDRIGTIETRDGPVEIWIDRVRREDGEKIWEISPSTVSRIPALHDELGVSPLAAALPAPLTQLRMFEIALWQWLALFLLLVAAYVTAWILAGSVLRLLRPLVSRSTTDLDDRILALVIGPVRLLGTVGVFMAGTVALGLAMPARRVLGTIAGALTVFAVTWLLFRLVDLASLVLAARLRGRDKAGALTAVPLGSRAFKVAIGALAILAALDTFGFDVTAVVAGLGVGGIAVALAAQKTIENVFGGVTVLTDQPVRVGDFCRFGDRVGTVEDIGLRSTRVRTLDRTVVTVPNADFSTMHLENFAMRDRILLSTTLGLRYETTPDQLRHVLVELRRMLYAHPRVLSEPARVRFASFADFSLNLELFCYVDTSDWNVFLAVREDLFLRMMDVVAESGTGFAFPSQTAYLAQDDGLDAEKSRAAEARVAEWREGRELPLPEFPAERIAELRASLDYPPEGSAVGEKR